MKQQVILTVYGIVANFFLFILKLSVALLSGSIAVFSDAFNSLVDILSSVATFFAVKISHKRADKNHPNGHHQAEPLAGLVIAIFAFTLAIEIIQGIFHTIFTGYEAEISLIVFFVLAFTIVIKILMSHIFLQKANEYKSPALKANGIDSKNDVLSTSLALFGAGATYLGYPIVEIGAAFAISGLIVYSGYKIGRENIPYLLGGSLPKTQLNLIKKRILSVHGIEDFYNLHAYFSGNYVNVYFDISIPKSMNFNDAIDLREHVRKHVLSLDFVNHVDVMLKKK